MQAPADVKWYVFDEYTKVDFTFNGMQLAGFYSKDGGMLGVARNIHFFIIATYATDRAEEGL